MVGTTSKEETVFDSSMRYEALTRKRNVGMEWNEIGYTRRFVRQEMFFYFLEMCIVKSFPNRKLNSVDGLMKFQFPAFFSYAKLVR